MLLPLILFLILYLRWMWRNIIVSEKPAISISFSLLTGAAGSSETSAQFSQTTRRHMLETVITAVGFFVLQVVSSCNEYNAYVTWFSSKCRHDTTFWISPVECRRGRTVSVTRDESRIARNSPTALSKSPSCILVEIYSSSGEGSYLFQFGETCTRSHGAKCQKKVIFQISDDW
jgi:hypothetical protein